MATTPTNLPIPSEDPRDLKFNAGKFDEVMTGDAHYYTDRFGVKRFTIAGFQYTAEEAIRNYGYITMDSFEDGATLTLPNQTLRYEATGEYYRWDGGFPKAVAPGSTPATTGGVGLGAWLSVGDATLRSQLISTGNPDLVDDSRIKIKQPFTGVNVRSQHEKNKEEVSLMDFGAIGDGSLHPLSEFYSTLADAQTTYPFITSLSQSIDFAAFQAAVNSGVRWVVAPKDKLYRYVITDTIRVSSNNTSLDLNDSEIRMVDATGLKSHFMFKAVTDIQLQGNTIKNATLINEYASTVHQIKTDFVAGFTVYKCTGYSPSYGHVWGFVELNRAIACFILRSITERMKDSSVSISGLAPAAHHSIDCMVYDCRFSDGDYGIKVGNYSEGMFFRRVFVYAQRTACIGFIPDSKTTALGSIKMQEIDFDSPNLTGNFLFMRYVKNVQVTGSWFSGPLSGPMIRTEETDAVMINSSQAYPTDAFILDNGIGTTLTSNMIVGGTVTCQFGPLADKTLIEGNSTRGVIACVDAGQHLKSLAVLSNKFEASGSAITVNTTNPGLHTYDGNTGDNVRGVTTSSFISTSPYVSTTGARPESISFRKASAISSIVVNDVEVYNSVDGTAPSFIGIGMLPPHTKFSVVFNTSNSPWLNRVKC